MTDREWRTSTDPAAMLVAAADRLSDRTLRLYLVGCCRRWWGLFTDEACRVAVEVAERFADGRATEAERESAERAAVKVYGKASVIFGEHFEAAAAAMTAAQTAAEWARFRDICHRAPGLVGYPNPTTRVESLARKHVGSASYTDPLLARELAEVANLLRCVAGDPWTYAVPDPRWRTAAAVGLATTIYETRDFAALPILADALEETGCDDPAVLDHCRRHREHARGCWVVDQLRGVV
jgi:hypothetical protein